MDEKKMYIECTNSTNTYSSFRILDFLEKKKKKNRGGGTEEEEEEEAEDEKGGGAEGEK